MGLSSDLISQFVKVTKDDKKTKKETTTYGTIVDNNGTKCVQLDGSDISTPLSSITKTADVAVGDRVTVLIKNHTATITGNLSNPSATYIINKNNETEKVIDKITDFEIAIGEKASIKDLSAEVARVDELLADNGRIAKLEAEDVNIKDQLTARKAEIEKLQADDVTINGKITANAGEITTIKSQHADFADATADNFEAVNTDIYNLNASYASFASTTTNRLNAAEGVIDKLGVTYANIDFSNIGNAAMEYFYANSGLIDNVTVADGTITGNLVGVTIKGDLIEANTLIADKLVILGEDGIYYKLNTIGETVEGEQTDYNSLNGQIITAKSITATQISVSDLVAFDATIGGFNITNDSIYSEVKDSDGNTTRGIYMDTDGQINFGDSSNYIKYYKDENGSYKLAVSADTILYSINGAQHSIADLGAIGEYVKIGTYEGEPCIELGENDSDFKLVITNTRILFMEDSSVPAYITNQSLHITKAVIEEEIQQGNFVWKARANGNLGLMWKGDS